MSEAMDNSETQAARKYHQATKHSVWSVQSNRHTLDWDNQPAVYKEYRGVEKVNLPEELPFTGMPALQVLSAGDPGREGAVLDLAQLAYLLYYSAGITKKLLYPGGELAFRAAACAGALYPVEIYVACSDLDGLPAGVYHFGPGDYSLRRLREGDYREYLARASGELDQVARAAAVLIFTAITWRSSWKYQARAYRYHYWDCGTILANSLAACAARHLPAQVVMGFVDGSVDQLIGIDGRWEKSLALLPVGRTGQPAKTAPEVPALDLPVEPLSTDWRVYPSIDELHQASRLKDVQAVVDWRDQGRAGRAGVRPLEQALSAPERSYSLDPLDLIQNPGKNLEETIVKRGSSRRFRQEPVPFQAFSTILAAGTTGFERDWADRDSDFLNEIFINVHAVEGLPAGAYVYRPEERSLILLEEGLFRGESMHLCLRQELGGTASGTIFFLSDLNKQLERYGNRGYRLAQMEAGILGGKFYLAAYALGYGASGLTFFDDDVVRFFSPAAGGLETIFVTALGVPAPAGRRGGRLVYTRPGTNIRD